MAHGDTTGRRPRRSTAATQRLERMRENKARLDAERRDKQRREEAALERFAEQEAAVIKREQQRDHAIAGYEEKIERERVQAAEEVAEVREQQAALLRELRAVDRTPTDIAALVEWPLKQVQRLLRETSSSPSSAHVAMQRTSERSPVPRSVASERGQQTSQESSEDPDHHVGSGVTRVVSSEDTDRSRA